ncbi:type II secretion system protein GspM [Endozoicomonas arenosclerae]|uniref:type II secretion system protein GspM n=1 Tax=Endozoicomonas arenosclerae TaxID=1633495 RepID=UPI00078427CB|nr:type II secretion system protein GspM [Endozoicomonas arenosclerae]
MNKTLIKIILLILVLAGAAVLYIKFKPVEQPVSPLPELTQLLERAQQQAEELAMPKAEPINLADWQVLMQRVADQNGLRIGVREGNAQQAEIYIKPGSVEQFVNGFADMYARGLRVQSIRLLEAEEPGSVKADTVKLLVSP